ncbi:hypothetical protein CLOM_g21090 [Closterium sp. NIES-68]|nr:hypothetical protein CLOM_g21090 [Closterium sp. NIES-68]
MPGLPPNRGKAPPAMLPRGVVPTTIIVAVPDDHVGAVVGKAGCSINEIQQTTGVRMVISDRNDYVEGTRDSEGSAEDGKNCRSANVACSVSCHSRGA